MTPEEYREQLEMLLCSNPNCDGECDNCILNLHEDDDRPYDTSSNCLYCALAYQFFGEDNFPDLQEITAQEVYDAMSALANERIECGGYTCSKCPILTDKSITGWTCMHVIMRHHVGVI